VNCGSSLAQQWAFVQVRPGYFKIRNRLASDTNVVMQMQDLVPVSVGGHTGFGRGIVAEMWKYGVSSTKLTNGAWAVDGDPANSEWSLGYNGSNATYAIINRETRACLTGDSSLSPLVVHAACEGSNRQLYQLVTP
jgi:hypothetical protein